MEYGEHHGSQELAPSPEQLNPSKKLSSGLLGLTVATAPTTARFLIQSPLISIRTSGEAVRVDGYPGENRSPFLERSVFGDTINPFWYDTLHLP